MSFRCEFRVIGDPKAQPRIKATVRRGASHATVYTPSTAKGWKESVVIQARPHKPQWPLKGPLRVRLCFLFGRPQRLMRKKDPAGPIWHTVKPDRDNLEKAVLDCLTDDGWFCDDAQVCAGESLKFYVEKGGEPGVRVCVEQLPC